MGKAHQPSRRLIGSRGITTKWLSKQAYKNPSFLTDLISEQDKKRDFHQREKERHFLHAVVKDSFTDNFPISLGVERGTPDVSAPTSRDTPLRDGRRIVPCKLVIEVIEPGQTQLDHRPRATTPLHAEKMEKKM